MQFHLTHVFLGIAIVAFQMSDVAFAQTGIYWSIAVIIGCILVLAYYSILKFSPANPIPRIAETLLCYAFINLAIMIPFTIIKQTLG